MITDIQVKKLLKYLSQGLSLGAAAARSGMDEKTGRKYRNLNKLPSDIKAARSRTWRTRRDPLGDLWDSAESFLRTNDGLEAKSLFTYFQRQNPGRIGGGQLRTFQRRVKSWRATVGAGRHELFFPKRHDPGQMSRSSFRNLSSLGVRLAGQPFEHLMFHFVLTYSNWETGSILLADDFPSLSAGLQKCLWDLGGTPRFHLTDGFDALAVKLADPTAFIRQYQAMLNHYRLFEPGNRAEPPDDNQIIGRYRHVEKALDQALTLRGSRDFYGLQEYEKFIGKLFEQLNQKRLLRLQDEKAVLRPLPGEKWRSEADGSRWVRRKLPG